MRRLLTAVAALVLVGHTALLGHAALADPPQDADPLAALATLGNAVAASGQQQGGGSIRAKRAVDPSLMQRLKDPANLEGRVEMVQTGKFPAVALRVKVTQPAKSGAGAGVKANDSLVIVPRYKIEGGQIAIGDADTLLNAGSFYLREGDRVSVRLGEQRDKMWEALVIERM